MALKWPVLCIYSYVQVCMPQCHILGSESKQRDTLFTLPDALCIKRVAMLVVEGPHGFHYSLSLWVSPACAAAASCHIGLNVNMLPLGNGALLTCFQTGVGFKSTCVLPVSFLDDVHTRRVPVYTVYTRSCASIYVAVHQSY